MSAKVTLSTSIKTSENLISERVETILIDDSEQMYETASKLLLEAFNLNTAVSNPLRSLTSNDWSKNVEDTVARLTTELELIEDFKEAMEILEDKTENPFQEALESDDEWFKWFESDCITCSVKIHSDISQEEEEAILISLLKMDNFSFVNEPECYDSLSEHFNNEVLDLYERNNPDQVDEEGVRIMQTLLIVCSILF